MGQVAPQATSEWKPEDRRSLSQAGAQQVPGWVTAGRGHRNENQTIHGLGFYSKDEGMTGGVAGFK